MARNSKPGQKASKPKAPKRRSKAARSLENPLFRARVVPAKRKANVKQTGRHRPEQDPEDQ